MQIEPMWESTAQGGHIEAHIGAEVRRIAVAIDVNQSRIRAAVPLSSPAELSPTALRAL